MPKTLLLVLVALTFLLASSRPAQAQAAPTLAVLDKDNRPVSQLTDGDAIKLQYKAPGAVGQATAVSFRLDPDGAALGACTIAQGQDNCLVSLNALGWYWGEGGQPQPNRTVQALASGGAASPARVQIAPRPVVMVHGFGSDPSAWTNYLGPQGYLAKIGIRGFAVGDGQVEGRLNLGSLATPTGKTLTIAQNAEILQSYIANVKKATGAQMVDLVAHSMGNLVSRYYIDRVMGARDIAQFLLMGPPNAGTDCAYLPASLGFYLPAALEIRPSYVQNVFNPQITHRRGIPFSAVAGVPIVQPVQSPCTAVPTDIAVSEASVGGIAVPVKTMNILHHELNSSEQVFAEFVKPLLQKKAGEFKDEPDPAPVARPADELQFTRILTGFVALGATQTFTIPIDNVAVASFALFDPTRSLTVTVRGASGNVIALSPATNGLIVVQDPATLVYLGYGFANPRPGNWQVTVATTAQTPSRGADFALTAQMQGGAALRSSSSNLLPRVGEEIQLAGRLDFGGQTLPIERATAQVRDPASRVTALPLTANGAEWKGAYRPALPGLYSIEVIATATGPNNTPVERSQFLTIEAQPIPEGTPLGVYVLGGVGAAILLAILGLVVWRRRRTA